MGLALCLWAGCAADETNLKLPGVGPSTGMGDGTGLDGPGAGDGDAPTQPGDGTGDGDGNGNGNGNDFELPEECASSSVTAPPAGSPYVDIVWIIDGSGSMLDEQARVTANLTKFANDITAAAVDVRIVMLTQSPADWVVCVYPDDPMEKTPLAGDPRYKFVKSNVNSHNLLQIATNNYASYKDFLRPGSAVNFVFLTDDESDYKGLPGANERAQQFRTDMTALLGRAFVAHSIASPGPKACSPSVCDPDFSQPICGFAMLGCGAASPGSTYYKVSETTGGLTSSICETDWTKIFTPLTEAVIESVPLPCDYAIPEPPAGEVFDPLLVNVTYTPAAGQTELLPKVEDAEGCADNLGWHYNSDVSKVVLCPVACNHVSAGGTLDIAFGCDTIVIF